MAARNKRNRHRRRRGRFGFLYKLLSFLLIFAAILAGFFLVALIRVFSSPFRLALKLLLNTLLGFLALGAVRLTAGLTGIALGLNLWNALVIAVLGLPGFVLLLLVQWIL